MSLVGGLLDCLLFMWRKFGLQLVGNRLRDLALNGKDVRQFAVISLRPEVPIGARIDQLRVDAHAIARALNASFHDMRDTKLLADLAQISRGSAFVLHHRSAADHFQIGDLRQVGENFVLHAIGEIGVVFVVAEVFKRQHSDAFVGW